MRPVSIPQATHQNAVLTAASVLPATKYTCHATPPAISRGCSSNFSLPSPTINTKAAMADVLAMFGIKSHRLL